MDVGKTFLLQKLKKDSNENFLVSYIDISSMECIDDRQLTVQSVFWIAVAGVIGALMPVTNSSTHIGDYSSDSSSSSGSNNNLGSSYPLSSFGRYSSSSNEHNVESYYDGDYDSDNTYVIVYDDESVESD